MAQPGHASIGRIGLRASDDGGAGDVGHRAPQGLPGCGRYESVWSRRANGANRRGRLPDHRHGEWRRDARPGAPVIGAQLRVTHHDTKISNVLFDESGKGICVIDLDTIMPGYFISDLGDMFRTYLSPANEEVKDFNAIDVRDDFFRAIVQGYVSTMGTELTEEEKRLILYSGKFIIYMQAMRFLADYINNDVYYGARYEEQNFVRAGNQLQLLKILTDKTEILQKIVSRN